jgi:predicted NBD/HSP70 family sugar kinase
VRTAPNLGWTNVPLRDLVADATGLPVLVTNDSDAATQAELSASPASRDMVLVHIRRGVGCGIVTDGRRVTGAHHAAGEIGHVTVGTDGGEDCPCGKRGCLETWLSIPRLRAAVDAPGGQDLAAIDAAGERLGVALAPLVAALDLSEVVLAGPEDLLTPVLPVLRRTLADRLLADPEAPLTVRLAGSPQDIVLRGAAALVLWDQLGVV